LSNNRKRILILGELYKPLIPWFLEDQEPTGAPAVYNLYQYLGNSDQYHFRSIVYNPIKNRTKHFPNGSTIELVKLSFPIYYVWKLLCFFSIFFRGFRELRKEKYDCVYGLSTYSTIAAVLGKLFNIKSVGRIYGTILTKAVRDKNYFRLYTRFFFDILAIKIPADKIICTQDGTEYDKVFRHFNKKKHVDMLYNGMDWELRSKLLLLTETKKLPSNEPIRLVYIARLESYKRQHLALTVVDKLIHDYGRINIELLIVGTGAEQTRVEHLIEELNLAKHVKIIKEIKHSEMPAFLEKKHGAMFFYEGGSLGNVLWECALAGKLIMAVKNGSTANVVNKYNGLISNDDEDFSTNMAGLINSYIDVDISHLTTMAKTTAADLIDTWDGRFDYEFRIIFQ